MRVMSFETYLYRKAKGQAKKGLRGQTLEHEVQKNKRLLDTYCLYVVFSRNFNLEILQFFRRYKTIYNHLCMFVKKYHDYSILDDIENLPSDDVLKELYSDYVLLVSQKEEKKKKISKELHLVMQEKGISNYRVYTDLNLNPGNTNDFLRNGNMRKMSFDNVKKILEYCNNY